MRPTEPPEPLNSSGGCARDLAHPGDLDPLALGVYGLPDFGFGEPADSVPVDAREYAVFTHALDPPIPVAPPRAQSGAPQPHKRALSLSRHAQPASDSDDCAAPPPRRRHLSVSSSPSPSSSPCASSAGSEPSGDQWPHLPNCDRDDDAAHVFRLEAQLRARGFEKTAAALAKEARLQFKSTARAYSPDTQRELASRIGAIRQLLSQPLPHGSDCACALCAAAPPLAGTATGVPGRNPYARAMCCAAAWDTAHFSRAMHAAGLAGRALASLSAAEDAQLRAVLQAAHSDSGCPWALGAAVRPAPGGLSLPRDCRGPWCMDGWSSGDAHSALSGAALFPVESPWDEPAEGLALPTAANYVLRIPSSPVLSPPARRLPECAHAESMLDTAPTLFPRPDIPLADISVETPLSGYGITSAGYRFPPEKKRQCSASNPGVESAKGAPPSACDPLARHPVANAPQSKQPPNAAGALGRTHGRERSSTGSSSGALPMPLRTTPLLRIVGVSRQRHAGRALGVALAPDGCAAVSVGTDGRILVHGLAPRVPSRAAACLGMAAPAHVRLRTPAPGSLEVATAGDSSVALWHMALHSHTAPAAVRAHRAHACWAVSGVAYVCGGTALASIDTSGVLVVWDVSGGGVLARLALGPGRPRPIAAAGNTIYVGDGGAIRAIEYCPDAQALVQAASYTVSQSINEGITAIACAATAGGAPLVVAATSVVLGVWSAGLACLGTRRHGLCASGGSVSAVGALLSARHLFVFAGGYKALAAWDFFNTGAPAHSLAAHNSHVCAADVLFRGDDAPLLVTAAHDGSVIFWTTS